MSTATREGRDGTFRGRLADGSRAKVSLRSRLRGWQTPPSVRSALPRGGGAGQGQAVGGARRETPHRGSGTGARLGRLASPGVAP
jgi:hypothetical protein